MSDSLGKISTVLGVSLFCGAIFGIAATILLGVWRLLSRLCSSLSFDGAFVISAIILGCIAGLLLMVFAEGGDTT